MESLPYTVIYSELPEKSKLSFSGQLIINHIEKITDIVNEKLSADRDLQMEIDNPESVDVTFIQLLLAITASVKANGKNVTISAELKDELKALIKNSGFSYVLN